MSFLNCYNLDIERLVKNFDRDIEKIIIDIFRTNSIEFQELNKCIRFYLDNKINLDKQKCVNALIKELRSNKEYLDLKEKDKYIDPQNPINTSDMCYLDLKFSIKFMLGAGILDYYSSNNKELDDSNNNSKTNVNINALDNFSNKFKIKKVINRIITYMVKISCHQARELGVLCGPSHRTKEELEKLYFDLFILGYSLVECCL